MMPKVFVQEMMDIPNRMHLRAVLRRFLPQFPCKSEKKDAANDLWLYKTQNVGPEEYEGVLEGF